MARPIRRPWKRIRSAKATEPPHLGQTLLLRGIAAVVADALPSIGRAPASAGPRRLAPLRARPALGVSVGEQQSHYCDTEQNKTDRAHAVLPVHLIPAASSWQRPPSRSRASQWLRRHSSGRRRAPAKYPRHVGLHGPDSGSSASVGVCRHHFEPRALNGRPTGRGTPLRCRSALCLMSLTAWTRPRRLALEPRCIGVAPSRPKLRTNSVTRGPNTSSIDGRLQTFTPPLSATEKFAPPHVFKIPGTVPAKL